MSSPAAEATGPSEGPGARLRREREQAGLSEQEAAERLSLDLNVVTALENNDFAALGAAVFARGHLRRYAMLLGLPEDDVLDEYARSRGAFGQPSLIPRSREAMQMVPARGAPGKPWIAGSLALFLVAAGVYAYVSEFGLRLPGRAGRDLPAADPATESPPDGDPAPVDGAPAAEARTSPREAAAIPTTPPDSAAAAVATSGAPVPPPGQVRLEVSFSADTWVEIYDGTGRAVLYDLGLRGTQRTITAEAPLSVAIGNAPAVSMRVNGKAAALPSPPAGQIVARFSIGPDGSLR